ncbi:GNAT family N-acetyltransferase [Paraburkholderia sabiae]|uniref:GNAT family N-acetyltransferase n=1 Tax=Paraburkholderia sabiae TaxID=273251 RepID=UPI001CC3AB11|nr:GNAT family N-acetyltransferase [Paraburkholderia sabiae]
MDTTISLKAYSAEDAVVWDQVVRQSCNGNFLHLRSYMDYHYERFVDNSVILFRNQKPVAVFPSNRVGPAVHSHGGLTYGGLLFTTELGARDTLLAFNILRDHYLKHNVESIIYKAVPQVFHRQICQNDLYALTCAGATLVRRDASSVIFLDEGARYSKGRKWAINKAKKSGITVRRSDDFEGFHALLAHVLERFNTSPVHSLEELRLLSQRFPAEIALYVAEHAGVLLAATLVYDFGHIVHTQYMANSEAGRDLGALDFLLAEIIEIYRSRKFFSFGISTEEQGLRLNTGLIAQKEAFGARTVVHDFYQWTL